MATEKEQLAVVKAALDQVDAATSKAATAVTAIQARIDKLLQSIIDSDSMAEINALAAQAQTLSSSLTPVSDALDAMGKVVDNPVPTPVPNPPPPTPVP